jgi:non-heme chloroperoxidase
MSTITVNDGTTIYYKDWGQGPVVTFSRDFSIQSSCRGSGGHFGKAVRFRHG